MPDDPTPETEDTNAGDAELGDATTATESDQMDDAAPESTEAAAAGEAVAADVKVPEFAPLEEGPGGSDDGSMDRFYDVQVPVWAELGRVEMPLGDLVKLSEGAVLRLNRPVSDPVDVISQGVKLARGEVIVVDDRFAIRIKEIVAKK